MRPETGESRRIATAPADPVLLLTLLAWLADHTFLAGMPALVAIVGEYGDVSWHTVALTGVEDPA